MDADHPCGSSMGTTPRVRPRDFVAKSSSARPQRSTTHPSGHDRPDRSDWPRPYPADRPDRPSQRRGRPEARFEARFHIFKARLNPKPPQKT
ncbi:unnamed protein product [Microthlaspi erraticum]|uniref:Uncharacterized protein n=1 Tax=Microthlaspi erraticum TaxID=1685480 RepID=A0A6D2JJR6_9BRAS|nr:unnamed protein product [Microthlaspi erraticum]